MKNYKIIRTFVAVGVLTVAGYGVAHAQEEMEISDQQLCQQEAEEAGMLSDQDIDDYVAQCLEDIQAQNEESASSIE